MTSRKTSKHLHDAAGSSRDAAREAIAAGAAGARALRHLIASAAHHDGGAEHARGDRKRRGLQGVLGLAAKPKRGLRGKHRRNKTPSHGQGGKALRVADAKRQVRKQDRRGAPRDAVRAAVVGSTAAPFTALGWCLLAGVILAWPRERSDYRLEGRVGNHLTSLRDRLRDELSTHETEVAAVAGAEPGRGRDAHSPAEIPPRGWRDVLKRTWKEFGEDRIVAVSGGVTFFSLLALFPAMAAFVSLYGLVSNTQDVSKHLSILAGVLPADALKFIGEQMVRMAQANGSSLSFTFFTTLLVSLWSANWGVKALFDGLNIAYNEKEKRNFFKLNIVSLTFTLAAILFLVLAAVSVIAVPIVLGLFGFKLGLLGPVLAYARWPILLVGVSLGLAALYRFGPSRSKPKWAWITPGSAAAALLWLAASMLFSWYVASFGSYNKTYGSLGAVVGFLTWMWLSTIVVLFGAELNSEIEHQTAVDSTTGAPERLGARGAAMADEVAPA